MKEISKDKNKKSKVVLFNFIILTIFQLIITSIYFFPVILIFLGIFIIIIGDEMNKNKKTKETGEEHVGGYSD